MKIFKNLTFWVLIAITTGILVGHYFPQVALYPVLQKPFQLKFPGQELLLGQQVSIGATLSEFCSSLFICLVKLFINPIIFLTISLGIVSMGSLKKVGRIGGKALLYFEIVTSMALLIGVMAAFVIRPGHGVDTSHVKGADISRFTQAKEGSAWDFLLHNPTLLFLIAAVAAGILLNYLSAKDRIVPRLQVVSKKVFKGLRYIMFIAPVGAFGGMAYTISKYGIKTLVPLGKLMLTTYITMAIFIFVVLFLILRYYKISLLQFLGYIRKELLVVLGTSSSESALPSLMEKLERMGCAKSVVGLVVPAGYSFNLDGTTIYLSLCMIFLAQVFHVHLDWGQVLTIIGILMLTSKGAAGVTGSGLVVLASTLTSIKVIPVEGLTLLVGVDRFMSEARALTNFIGNGVATVWLANNEKEFDRAKMQAAFAGSEE